MIDEIVAGRRSVRLRVDAMRDEMSASEQQWREELSGTAMVRTSLMISLPKPEKIAISLERRI